MITGMLTYDPALDRLDIMTEDGDTYGGLFCGASIDIMSESGSWIETRVEYSDEGEWYLPGLYAPGQIPYGLMARLPNKCRFL